VDPVNSGLNDLPRIVVAIVIVAAAAALIVIRQTGPQSRLKILQLRLHENFGKRVLIRGERHVAFGQNFANGLQSIRRSGRLRHAVLLSVGAGLVVVLIIVIVVIVVVVLVVVIPAVLILQRIVIAVQHSAQAALILLVVCISLLNQRDLLWSQKARQFG